jgi:hypothetical protein
MIMTNKIIASCVLAVAAAFGLGVLVAMYDER